MRLASGNSVLGWGYEGKNTDDLLADAKAWGVVVVVDVRLNPMSRKPGFSKRRLTEALEQEGIGYEHLPALGNPRENRAGFADSNGPEGAAARARFTKEVLATDSAAEALARVVHLAEEGSVVLLCYEAAERCCHRALVLDAIRTREASLVPSA